ncbi:MAG: hypothetical protein LBP36_03020 [Oscillospiraceae bacterium]|jgi:hypothetical protein|nr:hypothetical protein [Oscillospiraceae bacterium]
MKIKFTKNDRIREIEIKEIDDFSERIGGITFYRSGLHYAECNEEDFDFLIEKIKSYPLVLIADLDKEDGTSIDWQCSLSVYEIKQLYRFFGEIIKETESNIIRVENDTIELNKGLKKLCNITNISELNTALEKIKF